MSEIDPNIPPILPGQFPGYPQPMPPIAPIPVQPLPYSVPMSHQQRPGILTAISVISIVVGCIGCISGLVGGCSVGEFYMLSKMSRTMGAGSSATTASSVAVSPPAPTQVTPPATPTTDPATDSTTDGTTDPSVTSPAALPPGALKPSEISGAVQRAQSASGNKLNAAQMSALTTALQDPNQTLITPGTAWSPVRMASVNPDGSAFVNFTGGYVGLSPQGQITTNGNMNVMPTFKMNGVTCLVAGIESIATIGLAIFVFVAAIMMLRNSPGSRKLHLIYAVFKIPLAIIAAWAIGSLTAEFYGSLTTGMGTGTAAVQSAGWIWGAIVGVGGLIYPVALLIALNTRRVREFYNAVR